MIKCAKCLSEFADSKDIWFNNGELWCKNCIIIYNERKEIKNDRT